jgi:hypothetical protein
MFFNSKKGDAAATIQAVAAPTALQPEDDGKTIFTTIFC